MFGREFGMMELTIETLTGASVELLVSPYETVYDIKAKIQKLEGWLISFSVFLCHYFHRVKNLHFLWNIRKCFFVDLPWKPKIVDLRC